MSASAVWVVCAGWPAAAAPARLAIPPAPEGLAPAADYRVEVNGQRVFVQDTPVAPFASFDFDGEVRIRIMAAKQPQRVEVRPLSRRVAPSVRDGVIEFPLTTPGQFSVELDGDLKRPLFLFANPPETEVSPTAPSGFHRFAGGKVHEPGIIEVKSGETVYLAPGAVVRGAVRARNAKNIRILGRGVLDGGRNRELLGGQQVHLIDLQECEDVTIDGLTLINSLTWQIVPVACSNVTIRNVKIVSGNNSDDGIDVVRSRHVTIERCFIRTKDDCIAVKTMSDPPSKIGTENLRVSDCVFWNAEWGNALEIGFELRASEVRNLEFRDSDIIHVERGATFSIHNGDSATVSKVRFENIRVEDSRDKLVDLAIFLSQYSTDRPPGPREQYKFDRRWDGVLSLNSQERREHAPFRGHIRDVVFKDIHVVGGPHPRSLLHGWDAEHAVENIVFDGLWIHDKKITSAPMGNFSLEHANHVTFK